MFLDTPASEVLLLLDTPVPPCEVLPLIDMPSREVLPLIDTPSREAMLWPAQSRGWAPTNPYHRGLAYPAVERLRRACRHTQAHAGPPLLKPRATAFAVDSVVTLVPRIESSQRLHRGKRSVSIRVLTPIGPLRRTWPHPVSPSPTDTASSAVLTAALA